MDTMDEALSALRWWRDAGVDMLVDEAPRDWLSPVVAPRVTAAAAVAEVPAPVPGGLPDSLAALAAWYADPATFADLGPARVAADGDPASGLMILTDMPEACDGGAGRLLSGDLGRLFDRILAAIGRDRASVYLAALCPARPVAGRIDRDAAAMAGIAAAARHHVALAAPRMLLLMGKEATQAMGIDWTDGRGRLHKINHDGGMASAIVTFHPRMLRNAPARKAAMWDDLRLLIEELDR